MFRAIRRISPVKLLISLVVVLNVVFLLLQTSDIDFRNLSNQFTVQKGSHKFENPDLALAILSKLDVFKPVRNGWSKEKATELYKRAFVGTTVDNDYCKKHREYFVKNPSYVFEEKNFMTSYHLDEQIRYEVLDNFGTNVVPGVGVHVVQDLKGKYDYPLTMDLSLIITFYEMFYFRQVGKQFSCLGQMSNHIPGHGSLYRKDKAAQAINTYAQTYTDRPECFNFDKFFPKNYLLFKEDQCREFFKIFNSEEYNKKKEEKNIVYLRKIGNEAHAATGVFPVDNKEETYINNLYKRGKLCGNITENNIMQTFIDNALLINGRKFDFRMFMLVASTNPFIVFYHDGFLRVSLNLYDLEGGKKDSLLTNTAMSKKAFKIAKRDGNYKGKTVEDLYEDHLWTFERLQDYLLKENKIPNNNWLDDHLRPEFKKAMVHLVRMSQKTFTRRSSLFELYGLDFMLDDNLNLWFIEGNIRPGTTGYTPDNSKFFVKMLTDQFEIEMSVLRSRMQRVYDFVNTLTVTGEVYTDGDGKVVYENLDDNLEEFQKVIQNRIDPEFAIKPDNGFSLIVDENLEGADKYFGFLKEDCL